MNPARLMAFTEAYAAALLAEMKAQPAGWKLLSGNDTLPQKAARVAARTHELIAAGKIEMVQTWSESFKRTCGAFKIPHTDEAIKTYLEGK